MGATYPSEIYESIGMMTFPMYGKIKNVPNHQPGMVISRRMVFFTTGEVASPKITVTGGDDMVFCSMAEYTSDGLMV